MAVDNADNVYTTGAFSGAVDFDPGVGIDSLSAIAGGIFISKLDGSGNFVWAKIMDGTGTSGGWGTSLSLDEFGNVYALGGFNGTVDFDPGPGVDSVTAYGSSDMFISKLNSSGNLIWVVNTGSSLAYTQTYALALDAFDNIYSFGYFQGTVDFDPGTGTANLNSVPLEDNSFIQKMEQIPAGIIEHLTDNTISIYPNPSNGIFNVIILSPTKSATIEIYNSIGELVFNKQDATTQTEIELGNQANGLYFVKVMNEDKIIGMKKIIKE
jgi:hypothetical protein